MCVCLHVNSTACLSKSRRQSTVLWEREDRRAAGRGAAGRGRRYRQERLTSPPRNTHPYSPHSPTSSVTSPVIHLGSAWECVVFIYVTLPCLVFAFEFNNAYVTVSITTHIYIFICLIHI